MSIITPSSSVILYCNYHDVKYIDKLQPGEVFRSKYGEFRHDDILNKPFGSKIIDRLSKSKWVVVLKPTPELISMALFHRTQIIYSADVNIIMMLLDTTPGKIIIEAGTGSGNLTLQLAQFVAPHGRVLTFEVDEKRHIETKKYLKECGLYYDNITCYYRDVYEHGFKVDDITEVDGIFLDVPEPWRALNHVDKFLKPLRNCVTFSPCIEQIQKTSNWFHEHSYEGIRVFEALKKPWGLFRPPSAVLEGKKRQRAQEDTTTSVAIKSFQFVRPLPAETFVHRPMRSHTSYILVATKAAISCTTIETH